MVKRSFISVVSDTFHPSPTLPRRWLSGMRTLLKNTSLKCEAPEICLMPRTSTPGERMSRKKYVSPLCFGALKSERVTMTPYWQ
jgi:hypothetical protein